jgi:integrase
LIPGPPRKSTAAPPCSAHRQVKKLETAYVRALLPRLAAKAEIEKRVHAHGLRHTHASELARGGVPMNVIQAQLGHSTLGTTSRYLAHIAPAEVIKVMQGREWEV